MGMDNNAFSSKFGVLHTLFQYFQLYNDLPWPQSLYGWIIDFSSILTTLRLPNSEFERKRYALMKSKGLDRPPSY